ncbi:MAG: Gfo/Idh/MocA family oxidoreductase [Actinomycetota bacterium]
MTSATTSPDAPRDSTLRYGVVGTGMMGVEHIENILALDGAVVTAVADPHDASQEAARRAVAEAGAPDDLVVVGTVDELLATEACDAVVIASPNHTHCDTLLTVLDSPLHVMIEKPLCTTIAECRQVVDAAAQGPAGRIVWMGLEYGYMPPTARLLQELAAGAVGNVRMVAVREHRFPFLDKVDHWNRFNRYTGGTLVEKCCHFFYLMNLATQARPVRVMASGGQDVNHLDERYGGERPDIIDNAYVIVEYDDGSRGMLDLCMFAEASRNEQEVVVVGDEGKIEAHVPENLIRTGRRADGLGQVTDEIVENPDIQHVGLHHGASYLEHVGFRDAINGAGPIEVNLLDGLWSVAVGVAAHRSIAEGRPVEMSEYRELVGLGLPR